MNLCITFLSCIYKYWILPGISFSITKNVFHQVYKIRILSASFKFLKNYLKILSNFHSRLCLLSKTNWKQKPALVWPSTWSKFFLYLSFYKIIKGARKKYGKNKLRRKNKCSNENNLTLQWFLVLSKIFHFMPEVVLYWMTPYIWNFFLFSRVHKKEPFIEF